MAITPAWALTPDDILRALPHHQVEALLPQEDPTYCYLYAGRLMAEGDLRSALMWAYIGQLRCRIEFKAHAGADSSLYVALNSKIGTPLNRYGAKHLDQWLNAIDAALAWDDQHENTITPKAQFAKIYAQERGGLAGLKSMLISRQDEIKAAAAGQELPPKNWAKVVPIASAKDLEGSFTHAEPTPFTAWLIRSSGRPVFGTEFEIKALSNDRILTIARTMWGEVGRGEMPVTVVDGAAKFELPDTFGRNPRGGGSRGVAYLRKSSDGDLVLERDMVLEGDILPNRPVEPESHRSWMRAAPGHSPTRQQFENSLGAGFHDYFTYTQALLAHGLSQDAAKWFYIAKLRAAVYRSLHPQTDTTGRNYRLMKDAAAHKLEYFCEQHPAEWRSAIDAAIAWDSEHPQAPGSTPALVAAAEKDQLSALLQTQQVIDQHPQPEAGWQLEQLLR